ncbi:MAG: TVP38/TMEM64 family protein [Firmicutes bacterium HGW-Firmicutes-12]|jgi:uncharacterized membrane protein YdjX (TVP38/TMEM64 family)|nr:MAG: TVP38/TMEM64 family protein [Firmicutes bacterium HGW-Firmicutes-12]
MKKKLMNSKKNVLKGIGLILAVALVFAVLMCMLRDTSMNLIRDPEYIKSYIENKGVYGMLIFIGLQILQIVVAFIPGEPIQLAGGYIYGTFYGFLLSTAGIMIGSVIAFLISRKFGFPIVSLLVKREKLLEYKEKIESQKGMTIIFFLCLIPGVPKDVLVYAVGLTPLKYSSFFLIYFIARIPAMLLASYMGAQLGHYNTMQLTEISAGAVLSIGVLYLYRKQIIKDLESLKMRKFSD